MSGLVPLIARRSHDPPRESPRRRRRRGAGDGSGATPTYRGIPRRRRSSPAAVTPAAVVVTSSSSTSATIRATYVASRPAAEDGSQRQRSRHLSSVRLVASHGRYRPWQCGQHSRQAQQWRRLAGPVEHRQDARRQMGRQSMTTTVVGQVTQLRHLLPLRPHLRWLMRVRRSPQWDRRRGDIGGVHAARGLAPARAAARETLLPPPVRLSRSSIHDSSPQTFYPCCF